jgi:transposase
MRDFCYISRMKTTIEKFPSTLDESHQLILELQKSLQIAEQELKNAYLLEQFRLAKQERFAPKSEKNIYQADLFDEAGIETEEIEENNNTIEIKNHKRKKHPVRKPLPADLPREQIIHDIKEEEKICECGIPLSRIGEEITEQLKFIPAKLSVVQHVRLKYACKPCQENVRLAPMPVLLLPKSNATPELVAHTIISKYADSIPLYRQTKIWNRVDIDLPRSTLCSWLINTADLCEPLVILSHKDMLLECYIQTDESPIQVLREPGRKDTSKSYLWVYRSENNVIFDYQQTRGGYHAQQFLQDFKGCLQTDAYSGYHFTEKINDIIHLGCMAHARKPFAQLAKLATKEGLAAKALDYLFMGSPEGAKAGAIFYSLIATCTANDIEPYKYFCTILQKIRLCKTEDDYRKLFPKNIEFSS